MTPERLRFVEVSANFATVRISLQKADRCLVANNLALLFTWLFIEAEIEFNVPDLPMVEVVPRISISHYIRRDFELRGSQTRSLSPFTH